MSLRQQFGKERYSVLGKKHALLSASHTEVQMLHQQSGAQAAVPAPGLLHLSFSAPLLPENKVEEHLRQLAGRAAAPDQCRSELLRTAPFFSNRRFAGSATAHVDVQAHTEAQAEVQQAELGWSLPPLRLHVVLPPMESRAHLQEFLAFGKQTEQSHPGRLQFKFSSVRADPTKQETYALVTVADCAHVAEVALLFARRPEVQWVERAYNVFSHNRWIKGLTDTGEHDNTPLFNSGEFTGKGEIVGVTDTGIDMKNCYFSDDDSGSVNYVSLDSASTTTADTSQRKVVQYIPYADDIEDKDGHGTHVAGIGEEKYCCVKLMWARIDSSTLLLLLQCPFPRCNV